MHTPWFSAFVRVMVILLGLAVIASGVNMARVHWATDEILLKSSESSTPRPQIDMTGLSPAAKADELKNRLADLQRQLDESRVRSHDRAEAREARSQARAFLLISSALTSMFSVLMAFQLRRAALVKPVPEPGEQI